jgi:hypothetical protein
MPDGAADIRLERRPIIESVEKGRFVFIEASIEIDMFIYKI